MKEVMVKRYYNMLCGLFFSPVSLQVFCRKNPVVFTCNCIIPSESGFFLFHYPVIKPPEFIVK